MGYSSGESDQRLASKAGVGDFPTVRVCGSRHSNDCVDSNCAIAASTYARGSFAPLLSRCPRTSTKADFLPSSILESKPAHKSQPDISLYFTDTGFRWMTGYVCTFVARPPLQEAACSWTSQRLGYISFVSNYAYLLHQTWSWPWYRRLNDLWWIRKCMFRLPVLQSDHWISTILWHYHDQRYSSTQNKTEVNKNDLMLAPISMVKP